MKVGIRKHEPYPEEKMDEKNAMNTICQVLREIYLKTDDEEIKLKCRVAISMAKSMNKKLWEYGCKLKADFWE